jgi:hypothetical protein
VAIQPIVTAWAHVRVMMKRRVLAQVLLEELDFVEAALPATHPQAVARRDLRDPRPRYLPHYPAYYVTYFDAEVARHARDYLNALDDYTAELRAERGTSAAAEDPLWRHARTLRRVGAELGKALKDLAGRRSSPP